MRPRAGRLAATSTSRNTASMPAGSSTALTYQAPPSPRGRRVTAARPASSPLTYRPTHLGAVARVEPLAPDGVAEPDAVATRPARPCRRALGQCSSTSMPSSSRSGPGAPPSCTFSVASTTPENGPTTSCPPRGDEVGERRGLRGIRNVEIRHHDDVVAVERAGRAHRVDGVAELRRGRRSRRAPARASSAAARAATRWPTIPTRSPSRRRARRATRTRVPRTGASRCSSAPNAFVSWKLRDASPRWPSIAEWNFSCPYFACRHWKNIAPSEPWAMACRLSMRIWPGAFGTLTSRQLTALAACSSSSHGCPPFSERMSP